MSSTRRPATDSPTPDETELAFTEVSEQVGLSYASVEGGAGNGNDGIYVGNLDGDLRMDVFLIGGERPALYRNTADGLERSDALPNVSALTDPGAGFIDHLDESESCRERFADWREHIADDIGSEWSG